MLSWWKRASGQERALEAVLRVGAAGCFIGHGAFGIPGKEAWLSYFAVVGIPESWAWTLMPIVGAIDILAGILVLIAPRAVVLGYMVVWAAWTALLRPLAGESFFEALERAGNYGIPLAFLVAAGVRVRGARIREWFAEVRVQPLTPERRRRVGWVLRGTLALLLIGHGGLAAFAAKPLLADHIAALGLGAGVLPFMGWGEMMLGVLVAWRPAPALLVLALVWKVGSEALYPVTGAPIWEFVERAGSYAAPLALLTLSPLWAVWRQGDEWGSPALRKGAAGVVGVLALGALSVTFLSTAPTGVAASASTLFTAPARQEMDLLEKLQAGTLVLACRHAITDRSRGDQRPVNYDDPSTQRILSADGREQARRFGEVLRDLEAPIGDVWASPYARTKNSADLAFGKVEVTEILVYGNSAEQRQGRTEFLRTPTEGGNRVLMTHQGILYDNFPSVERGSIREGDCIVVEPHGPEFTVLGRFGPEELAELGRKEEDEGTGPRRDG